MPGIAPDVAALGFGGPTSIPGIESARGLAGRRAGFLVASPGFTLGAGIPGFALRGAAFLAGGFLAGIGIFMPGMLMPPMSCADAGEVRPSAVPAARVARSRIMPPLPSGAR